MSGTPAYIQPVGVNRLQISAATALLCDTHERILFNCGESLQRLATEWRLKISKVTDVVMMQLNPAHIGGLTGLLLSLESIEAPTFDYTSRKSVSRAQSALREAFGKTTPVSEYCNSSLRFGSTWIDQRWRRFRTTTKSVNPCIPADKACPITIWWRTVCPFKANQTPKQTFEEYMTLRHTARSIRIWGPPGLAEIIQSHSDLTARLRKLIVEIIEIYPSATGCAFTKDLFGSLDVNLQLFPMKIADHANSGADSDTKRRKTESDASAKDFENEYFVPLITGIGKRQLGKLLVDKCRELKVPPGPMYAELKAGGSVTLADGTVVSSQQVCEDSFDGVPYIVSHCANTTQLERVKAELSSNPDLRTHLDLMRKAGGFVYNMGLNLFEEDPDVFTNAEVESECQKPIQQVNMVDENSEFTLPFVAQHALNLTLQNMLPALHPLRKVATPIPDIFLKRFPLVPHVKVSRFPTIKIDVDKLVQAEFEELKNRIDPALEDKARNTVVRSTMLDGAHTCGRSFHAQESKVTLLGTGAAMPSKFRNVSSTILAMETGFNVLLDCGEGTLTQLFQLYGDQAPQMIRDIRLLFVSHKHGDHINGLPGLLEYRSGLPNCPPLHVLAPSEMEVWFESRCGSQYIFTECESLTSDVWVPLFDTGSMCVNAKTAYVDHINCSYEQSSCFACRLRFSLGTRKLSSNPLTACAESENSPPCEICSSDLDIAFTGDMAPCEGFTNLITTDPKTLAVLIHEATFEDELENEAVARRHCTISNCFDAAEKSQAGLLIMTHFSQRYPSVSPTNSRNLKVAHGLDFLTIPIASFWLKTKSLDPSVHQALELDKDIILSLQDRLKIDSETPLE